MELRTASGVIIKVSKLHYHVKECLITGGGGVVTKHD